MLVTILKVVQKIVCTGSDVKRCGVPYPLAELLSRAPLCTYFKQTTQQKTKEMRHQINVL
jgi:hypothetical protein